MPFWLVPPRWREEPLCNGNDLPSADETKKPEIWSVPEAFRQIYAHSAEVTPGQRLLYIAGQVGVRPDGTLPRGFEAQCAQAMANVEALLSRAGMSHEDLIKVTYLLTDRGDLPLLIELRRARWSTAAPPAATVMVVTALGNPRLRVEIEAVAASRRDRRGPGGGAERPPDGT